MRLSDVFLLQLEAAPEQDAQCAQPSGCLSCLSGRGEKSRKSTKLNLKPVFGSGVVGIRIDLGALLDPDLVAIKLTQIIHFLQFLYSKMLLYLHRYGTVCFRTY